ncbi:Similar to TPD52L2: Tumor protein D54 (Pongo abelii) [Cotesia congregata]|uniref:Similar to TPD52L2: Tumor protein D54 (Pongo abelii) n=1 Tax=Cotesia congregata TaxID=51543 RepID=A0A8J2HJQ6_COTCN|nr:Similar to TPD52L2: Tumor protein D54 (Pongo abelii) [Cotesia congregata]
MTMKEDTRDGDKNSDINSVKGKDNNSRSKVCNEHGDDCPSENEREFDSLEYEEDVYYSSFADTPSFDDIDNDLFNDSEEIVVHCWKDDNIYLDEILVNDVDFSQDLDANCSNDSNNAAKKKLRKLRSVRVIFKEMTKSYFEKLQGKGLFFERLKGEDALHSGSLSPSADNVANELAGLSFEEQERQKAEWRTELAKVEEEIQTLRHVLASKVRVSQELKRKLGISVWKDITEDVNQGLRNVKESNVYNIGEKLGHVKRAVSENSLFQKTESVCKQAAGMTQSFLGGFGSGITMKLGQMLTPSRSNSTQSFDEALRESEATRRASGIPSVATSPTIPEEKLLS